MFMDLVCLGMLVMFVTPTAMVLLVWRGNCGWGKSILMRVWWKKTIPLVVMKRATSSDWAMENMVDVMIWAIGRIGLLNDETKTSLERKMCAPARLRALLSCGWQAPCCWHDM